MSLILLAFLLLLTILNGTDEILVDDARIDIEAINFNLIYWWLIRESNARKHILDLFTDDINIMINEETDDSIDLLLKFKESLEISDGDLIIDTIDISYDNEDGEPMLIHENGHYYFYNEKNIIVDAGKYEKIWKLNNLSPKYVIKSISLKTLVTDGNINNLYFDEHDMGKLWVIFWDSMYVLDDKNDEKKINNFLSKFSINFELNFVDTKDVERILFGRKQLIEWMSNYNGDGMYGEHRLILHKTDDVIMYKISPWQTAFEADIILMDRKTKTMLKEERWLILMGYDVINRKFYRATQFYDNRLFEREINQIQKRFPFARDKLPKNEL